MSDLRFVFLVTLAFSTTGAFLVGGCSSKTPGAPLAEAGTGEDVSAAAGPTGATEGPDAGSQGPQCSPISGTSCPSQQGLTCCIDLTNIMGLLSGAPCVPVAQCKSAVQYECLKTSDCPTPQVCCASFPADGGIPEAGLPEGGLGGLLGAGAGAGGLGGMLGGINIHVSCQPSCNNQQEQLCAASSDCVAPGDTCQAVSTPGLSGGGQSGAGGLLSMLPGGGANAIMPMACLPPDAGAPPVDSGPAQDGAPYLDAAAPNDAPIDAPADG
jgi:hypothetical protein